MIQWKRSRPRVDCRLAAWSMLLLVGCATTRQHESAHSAQPVDPAREESVKPGINTRWKSTDIEPLVATLDAESREIYANRELLAAVAGPRPGTVVADVGAGSGFMAQEFSKLVGPAGKVYAVDINPHMMERVAREALRKGLKNIETVVCGEKSIDLPPDSVDLIFICDTYHHFEYPRSTMRSIHNALRPGGQIVLVDFRRIPGVSRPFILGHVRAAKDVFIREIAESGFKLINAHDVPALKENYVLRFTKVEADE